MWIIFIGHWNNTSYLSKQIVIRTCITYDRACSASNELFFGMTYVIPRVCVSNHDFFFFFSQLRQIAALEQQLPRNGSAREAATRDSSRRCTSGSTSSSERSLQLNRRLQSAEGTPASRPQQASKREVRTAKNLAIIVIFFMICWLPLYTVNCVQAFCSNCIVPIWLLDAFIVLSHVNSALNPFLYAYHMSDFRNALRQHFWCGASGNGRCKFRTKQRTVEMDTLSAPALTKMAANKISETNLESKGQFSDVSS